MNLNVHTKIKRQLDSKCLEEQLCCNSFDIVGTHANIMVEYIRKNEIGLMMPAVSRNIWKKP